MTEAVASTMNVSPQNTKISVYKKDIVKGLDPYFRELARELELKGQIILV